MAGGSGGGDPLTDVAARVAVVRQEVAEAAVAAGRSSAAVRLVAVTKSVPAAVVAAAVAAGITDVGENRVQEARGKYRQLGRTVTWHLIGLLQTNKVKYVLEFASWIHSLDRAELGQALEARLSGRPPLPVLVEVNIAAEATKGGVSVEELGTLLDRAQEWPHLDVRGLMCVAPAGGGPRAQGCFERLAELSAYWQARGRVGPELSMGMSDDFREAIRAGATMVRLGRAIFGERR